MRQSQLLMTTMRDMPSEAEALSHQWMLRGGYIRQTAAGIYSYLPLGWRVLRKIEGIIRQEMDAAGAQEMLMPAVQPAELWKESGRYDVYGPELIRLHDRHDREFVLGPTHEEVITSIVRQEISSYRKLPVNLYQIQSKYRDERRPRFGLLRGREFLMKDAYSFDRDWEGLDVSYRSMYEAYERIFERCGLTFRAVEADAGAIGGQGETHEFMALADIGEDTVVSCRDCRYAANLERAESVVPARQGSVDSVKVDGDSAIERVVTPNVKSIQELTDFLQVGPEQLIKTLIYQVDGQLYAVLIRGDREANETKVKSYLKAELAELASAEEVVQATGAPVGFAGPVGLSLKVLVDYEVASMTAGITGANQVDVHLKGVRPGQDFSLEYIGDFRNVKEGEPCPRCGAPLQFHRGIELGHVFKLGTKYSEVMNGMYLDSDGREKPLIMGCYGIGVSRVMAAIAEQRISGERLVWPMSVAPFQVHVIPVAVKDEAQMNLAEHIYKELIKAGLEPLLDDRDERAGVKFKDADLAGAPQRLIIGRGAASGEVEWMGEDGVKVNLPAAAAIQRACEAAARVRD
ncbi:MULTISPECIES: proline--tRNA ligase [Paenibacillus]|uniref:proline--tRNA ligase n=1 Tax=Paenibacillus TaxID=44249 RepID=UPI00116479D6|nr:MULTISPECIES: proline--tRNA ligase [Paenibacillus]AWP29159.1 proline--tRNA ligase [Paenibacillus sp. Cedars]MPY20415.1 proline--tRNA ligase [Paenibacillus glucanolyticus]